MDLFSHPSPESNRCLRQCFLGFTDALIVYEFETGYVPKNGSKWDDRMHILINISSCTNVVGQSLSKTAFGVTLLKLTTRRQQYIIWFCIVTMNLYMAAKNILQWAKLCDEDSTDVWYRLDFCVETNFRDDIKVGGNGQLKGQLHISNT